MDILNTKVPERVPETGHSEKPQYKPEHVSTEFELEHTVAPAPESEHVPVEVEADNTKAPDHVPEVSQSEGPEHVPEHIPTESETPEQKPQHIPSIVSDFDHTDLPLQKPEQIPVDSGSDITLTPIHVQTEIGHDIVPTVKPIHGLVTSADHTVSSIEHGIIPGEGNYSAHETTKSPVTSVSDHKATNIFGASVTTENYPHESPGGFHFTTAQIIPSEKPTTGHHFSTEEPLGGGEGEANIPSSGGAYLPPSSGGSDYDEDDEQAAFGPGTCRYGGKVYVSAQQIPRDDPCDFCFCFRSDIICLQQSCPPPIKGCHEEPIQGFCCPRYECPVSMATSVNVTTTTTTTTTTLPPHFFSHAYKGVASRTGCQIQGQAYRVGEIVRSASGPCLTCRCGGDGQMKCDPKVCSPEPMLRKMIEAVSTRRR
ncbi:hypothetical protein L798_12012 [Zootermopsis nevadensis]|uniref:VWFC domain-containing protein n=3 Tax=Zootermopsis nevadensis TaxID=136037 RepID=A0A067QV02_ZOONE|nr:hypothetical protein L798_12012 [Zootermopsis nevadensis]